MNFYIMKNKEMPWGDYGDALCYGYLNQMDKNRINVLEIPELERSGPYIPALYTTNFISILATEPIKDALQSADLKGIRRYVQIVKKQIVEINWREWDSDSEEPEFYPDSGEPEDYIWKGVHDEELAKNMPEVFYLEIEKKYFLKQISDVDDYDYYTHLKLEEEPDLDIFYPSNKLFVVVSEKCKTLIEKSEIDTVDFIKLQKL